MNIDIGKEKIVNLFLTSLVLLSIFGSFIYFYKMNRIDNKHFKVLMEIVVSEPFEEKEIEEPDPESVVYYEEVQFGDGLTHVARRLVSKYLEENKIEIENERKIFLEDYIQKRIEQKVLEVSDTIVIHEELIVEAFSVSWELNEDQLDNLRSYSLLVKSFD